MRLQRKTQIDGDILESSLLGLTGVAAWLESPARIAAYYQDLTRFYQLSQFPPKSFDVLLAQLRSVVSQHPDIGERLWETSHLGEPIWIEGNLKNFDRVMDYPGWLKYYGQWVHSLKAMAQRANRAATLEFIREETEQFEKRIAACRNEEDERLCRGQFFRRMHEAPQNKDLASELLVQFLNQEKNQNILLNCDADVVLSFFSLLDTHTADFIPFEESSVLLTVIRRLIPKTAWLLRLQTIFTYAGKDESKQSPTTRHPFLTYEFRPLSRRFHGIWKGGSVSDCVGGALSYEASTTPQRWGLSAIRESQTFHIFQHYTEGYRAEPSYKGFAQIVPLLHKVTKKNGAA